VANTGSDATTCTQAAPCATIGRAQVLIAPNEGIFVSAGTHTLSTGITLTTGVALACIGPNHTTVISNALTGGSMLTGSQGSIIDGCKIVDVTTTTFPVIIDSNGDMKINNCILQGNNSTAGISLSNNTIVQNSTIMGFTFNASGDGIMVTAGNAIISNNTITANTKGINASNGALNAVNNSFAYNQTGLLISGGTATIIGNTINTNASGISIQNGTVTASGNILSCNSTEDIGYSISGTIDMTNSFWDHSPPSTAQVSAGNCASGTDICAHNLMPLPLPAQYTPYSLVSSPCP
jgi:hypothetical protein